jgi:hypothetical protein
MDHCAISAGVFHKHADSYREKFMVRLLEGSGFSVLKRSRMASPSAASKATTDLIVLAKKRVAG